MGCNTSQEPGTAPIENGDVTLLAADEASSKNSEQRQHPGLDGEAACKKVSLKSVSSGEAEKVTVNGELGGTERSSTGASDLTNNITNAINSDNNSKISSNMDNSKENGMAEFGSDEGK